MYENIWPTVFDAIADGASLKSALRQLNPSPSYAWAKKTLRNDPELHSQYREAQQDRADRLAEQIIELADTPMPEGLEGKERSAWVQHLRDQIDSRKWVAAKLHPRIYGERLDVSMTETRIIDVPKSPLVDAFNLWLSRWFLPIGLLAVILYSCYVRNEQRAPESNGKSAAHESPGTHR